MADRSTDISAPKLLPGAAEAAPHDVVSIKAPPQQLSQLPLDELRHLAEDLGLDGTRFKTSQHLVTALHEHRQLIATLDREALLDIVKWGRRPVTVGASKEQIAQEIARIRTMRFAGLSQRGLAALARLRGLPVEADAPVPILVKRLKKQEGFFSKLNRKRRAMLGAMVSGMLGEAEPKQSYQFLPSNSIVTPTRHASIKEEIEEAGLIGGITGRLKKSADSYLNQKLDEIEQRIDRKLDEIDRRLTDWRDKEIANRIRILKITLWASVIVGGFSLLYSYIQVYFWPHSNTTQTIPTPHSSNLPAASAKSETYK